MFLDVTNLETSYGADSGGTVVLRHVEPDLLPVLITARPDYSAQLRRNGVGDFDLTPVNGMTAAGGIGLDLAHPAPILNRAA